MLFCRSTRFGVAFWFDFPSSRESSPATFLLFWSVQLISVSEVKSVKVTTTPEGADVVTNGSLEARLFALVPIDGIQKAAFDALGEVQSLGAAAQMGMGQCMKNKWLRIEKDKADKSNVKIIRQVESITDETQAKLAYVMANSDVMDEATVNAVTSGPFTKADCANLMKRQLLRKVQLVSYTVGKGARFTLHPEIPESDLTSEMLIGDAWKGKVFRKFNLDAAPEIPAGALHPLLKVRSEFRQIFLEMGFEEMPTAQYVESSFWNFDALFQPQQHPARDSHDTFFMKSPVSSADYTEDYLEKVKEMHEVGGHGSIGYRYDWSKEEASKNILRTHTTAVSTRMLYQLGQEYLSSGVFRPVKYFSIDRVFRNETLDATHLAEFHQVEGLVADRNLTLANLIGILHAFFQALGMKDLKFKPAYNPYTEPSMEIFAYHPDLKKEVEIGNSGVFRPEMLRPMGLPEDVTVIAWGLSVERPTMIKYGYKNIRDLFGAGVDLKLVANNPICRL